MVFCGAVLKANATLKELKLSDNQIGDDGVSALADALGRGPKNSTWDNQGACDGTVSFPDLGRAPFDGTTPIIMYTYALRARSLSVSLALLFPWGLL